MLRKNIFYSFCLSLLNISLYANTANSDDADKKSPYEALATQLRISAKEAVLIDFHSETVLFDVKAHERMTPSSMTKMMTIYETFAALEAGDTTLDSTFVISEYARYQTGSRMFVEQGTSVPVRELIKGTIVSSGNDSSVALAEGLAGSEEVFASLMTAKARSLGALNTQFLNSNGMPLDGHYSTAYDLAIIAMATLKHFPDYYEQFYPLIKYKYNNIEQYNRNSLLRSAQNDYIVDGLKTGATDDGGFGLVFSAKKAGIRLVGVVNGLSTHEDRIREARTLLQWGFNQHNTVNLMAKHHAYFSLPIEKGELETVEVITPKNNFFSYRTSEGLDKLSFRVENLKTTAPIAKGDHIANLYVTGGLKEDFIIPLHAASTIKSKGFLSSLYDKFINLLSPKTLQTPEEINKMAKTSLLTPIKSTQSITF